MTHAYSTIITVAQDGDLQQRFIAAAAAAGIENPDSWVLANRWKIAAHDQADAGLLDSYQYVVDTDPNHYKDWGRDPGIISDAMIEAVVQALKPVPPE
jgi:hypothetical protein